MRRTIRSTALALSLGALITLGGGSARAAEDHQTSPDNTKVNKRDRASGAKTADRAKETSTDRETMRKIRQALVADKSLSTYGHNIKVISTNGQVTLKGPVHTDEERQKIVEIATQAAGHGNITDQISVKGAKSTSK